MTIWKELQQIEKIIEILKNDYENGCYEYDNTHIYITGDSRYLGS